MEKLWFVPSLELKGWYGGQKHRIVLVDEGRLWDEDGYEFCLEQCGWEPDKRVRECERLVGD